MSGKLAIPMRKIGKRLIDRFGKTVTITYVTPATYSPATGLSTPTTSTADVKAIVADFTEGEFNELVLEGDVKVTVAAKGITAPDQQDRVTIDSVVYHIVNIEYIAAGITAALYEIQVRK